MSGPIVRKYGFPNFEKIFGERELKHGDRGEVATPDAPNPAAGPPEPTPSPGPGAKAEGEPKKP